MSYYNSQTDSSAISGQENSKAIIKDNESLWIEENITLWFLK